MDSILKGFETKEVTLYCEDAIAAGSVVTINKGYTVSVPGNDEAFCGLCTGTSGTFASVVLRGIAEIPYSGTAPKVGYAKLSSDGNGNVKVDTANGREYLILSVDTNTKTLEILL